MQCPCGKSVLVDRVERHQYSRNHSKLICKKYKLCYCGLFCIGNESCHDHMEFTERFLRPGNIGFLHRLAYDLCIIQKRCMADCDYILYAIADLMNVSENQVDDIFSHLYYILQANYRVRPKYKYSTTENYWNRSPYTRIIFNNDNLFNHSHTKIEIEMNLMTIIEFLTIINQKPQKRDHYFITPEHITVRLLHFKPDCGICMEPLNKESFRLTKCFHEFCVNCINQLTTEKCPICRSVLV